MNTIVAKLKERLRDKQAAYVDHNSWLGSTETGFYSADEFDIDKLMAEIDAFAAEFEEKRKGQPASHGKGRDMSDVRALPVDATPTRSQPKHIVRPCDWKLHHAVQALETQVGTVEAYNRLCDAAAALKQKIDAGDAHKPADMWLTDPNFIYPAG